MAAAANLARANRPPTANLELAKVPAKPLDNELFAGSLVGQSFSHRFRFAKVVHRA
jgi:hypothetical protein